MASPTRQPRAVVVGSLNLDEIFVVPHIAAEGETLSADEYFVEAGGKGANQSVALAKAGAEVYHCGRIGPDGRMLTERMEAEGVRVVNVIVSTTEHTGRAIVQLSASTRDNAIVLFPGANHRLGISNVRAALVADAGQPGDWLVMQNEVRFSEEDGGPSAFHELIKLAKGRGMLVAFSPAPYTDDVSRLYPLDFVDVLVLNKHEARGLAFKDVAEGKEPSPEKLLELICLKFPAPQLVVLTLGAAGILAHWRSNSKAHENIRMQAAELLRPLQDTTGAGDTFTGYLMAGIMRRARCGSDRLDKAHVEDALREAVVAAAMSCERHGAMAGVPTLAEVNRRLIDFANHV